MPQRVRAVLVAGLAFAVLALLVQAALWTETGQRIDQHAMEAVYARQAVRDTLLSLLGRVSIGLIGLITVVCVITALLRQHYAFAIGAMVVIAGSNLTTQVLKHQVLTRDDFGFGVYPSLPSGHTTVVASAAAALLLVVPAFWRATIACLGTFATAITGMSTIVPGWHRPADVIAACLVCLVWSASVSVVLGGYRTRSVGATWSAFAGAVIAVVGIVLVGVRPRGGWAGVLDATLVLGAVGAAAAACLALVVLVCPSENRPRTAAQP